MKRRHRHILSLFSFGLLVFALYLNFVKKESTSEFAVFGQQGSPLEMSGSKVKPQILSVKEHTSTAVLK